MHEAQAYLGQYLPAEVADVVPLLGINDVSSLDGSAAIVRVDGQLSIKYEFRTTVEIVMDG